MTGFCKQNYMPQCFSSPLKNGASSTMNFSFYLKENDCLCTTKPSHMTVQ